VRVEAPAWVDVSRVTLLRRGVVLHAWEGPFAPPGREPRFEQKVTEELHKGDWVIAVVRGKKEMSFLHRRGGLPFAFTNPIWVE
jgi:hypothetical protein